jgi:hypothetical protein
MGSFDGPDGLPRSPLHADIRCATTWFTRGLMSVGRRTWHVILTMLISHHAWLWRSRALAGTQPAKYQRC